MKKVNIKIIVSLLLVFILLSSNMISAFAYSIQSSTITGKIVFDESETIDVSKIKLNVYRLELIKDDTASTTNYAHIYNASVYPDKNGNVKLNRPSAYSYIEVDMNSVPSGFGVSQTGVLISTNENEFLINISAISDFTVDFNTDAVEFFDSEKNPLFVNQEHEVIYDDNIEKVLLNQNDSLRGTNINKKASVKCVFDKYTIESQQPIESLSLAKRIDFLHKKGLLTEEERVNQYINGLENGSISEHLEVEKAFSIISDYSINNELTQAMDETITNLVSSYIPTYENEAVVTDNYFAIHYEEGDVSSRNLLLTRVYLNHAKTSLCSTFEFETPELAPGETRYQVYLKQQNEGSSGYNIALNIDGKKYSFIVIFYDNGQTEFNNYRLGTICHEFTHAVQLEYASTGEIQHETELINFNEAVADAVNASLVPNCGAEGFIYQFQQTPELSLFSSPTSGEYIYRQYGAMLFPLYLVQEYSDFNTIRQIYEEQRLVGNIYTAIDNVLQDSDSSFSEAYAQFALFNYDIQNYYRLDDDDWTDAPKKTAVYSNSYSHHFPLLSSRYFEFTGSQNTTFALSFHNSNYINYAKLQQIYTADGELFESEYPISSSSITILINLEQNEKTCLILSNISLTSSMMCSVRTL